MNFPYDEVIDSDSFVLRMMELSNIRDPNLEYKGLAVNVHVYDEGIESSSRLDVPSSLSDNMSFHDSNIVEITKPPYRKLDMEDIVKSEFRHLEDLVNNIQSPVSRDMIVKAAGGTGRASVYKQELMRLYFVTEALSDAGLSSEIPYKYFKPLDFPSRSYHRFEIMVNGQKHARAATGSDIVYVLDEVAIDEGLRTVDPSSTLYRQLQNIKANFVNEELNSYVMRNQARSTFHSATDVLDGFLMNNTIRKIIK